MPHVTDMPHVCPSGERTVAGLEVTGPEGDGSKRLVRAGDTMVRPCTPAEFLTNQTETTWLMPGSFSCTETDRGGIVAELHAGLKAADRD